MADLIIILIIAAYCIYLIAGMLRKRKTGKGGCGCGCSGSCSSCSGCSAFDIDKLIKEAKEKADDR